MKDTMLKKEFGEVTEIPYDKKELIADKHLCWENCANASCDKCQKIADEQKKTIDNYDFIDGGCQTFDKNGIVDRFIVFSCKNYTKEEQKQKLDILSRKKAIKDLLDLYYDSLILEDAHDNLVNILNGGKLR